LDRPWHVRIGPAGIALDESNGMMYTVTREDKMLYAVDLKTKKVVKASSGHSLCLSGYENERKYTLFI
jgi:DNA-binding beta-propeller fold protein YncE